MKYIIPTLLCLLFFSSSVFALQEEIKERLSAEEANFNLVLKQSESLRNSSYNESIHVGKKALELAKSIGNNQILGESYKSLALTLSHKGALDSALMYITNAIEKFELCNDTINVAITISMKGGIYRDKCEYDKALDYYMKAMSIYKQKKYERGEAVITFNVGGIYQKLNQNSLALENYLFAKEYFEKNNDQAVIAKVNINVGVIYNIQKKHHDALNCFLRSYDISKEQGNKRVQSLALLNIGKAYEGMEDHLKALDYYSKCEDIRLGLNDIWGLAKVYTFKAHILSLLNKKYFAENYFKKALKINLENKYYDSLEETYYFYSAFLEKNNRNKKALLYYKKYYQLVDSIERAVQHDQFEQLKAQYESEKQVQELKLLEQKTKIQNLKIGKQNAWIAVLVVVLLLGFVAVIVSLRINRLRADHKILDLRQRVLLTQMNPHFLFNSLTAIQSFILDEKNDDANNYLARLASLVRGILENSREEFVSLKVELETLEEYIGMQKLRFDNDINYEFNIDSTIDVNRVMVPPMLAQPFVENALIHGRLRNNPDAKIDIKVFLNDKANGIQFQIIDNGIGLEESKKNKSEKGHKSLATSIALDRVKIYNFKSARKMHFEIIDRKNIEEYLHGTQVSYSIPLLIN